MALTLSPAGKALIKRWETLRLVAYDDKRPGVTLKPGDHVIGTLTIGWGHTGRDVFIGRVLTPEWAEALFAKDIAPIVAVLNQWLTWPQVQQCQFDAMCSLAFNIGLEAFKESTLLKLFNHGDMDAAANEFTRWDYVEGKPSGGLLKRRDEERTMFLGEA